MSSQLPLQISHAQGFLRKMEKNKELEWAKAQKIEIGVDLVAAAKHQLHFLSLVDTNRFLHEGPTLDRAIYRYNAYWLPLLAKHCEAPLVEGPLVVPLDCEWIWHCHRLNPVQYKSDCEELYGKILDNSNVISTIIIESFCLKETEKVWNELYPQEPFNFNFNSQEDLPKQLSQLEKYTTYDLVSAVKRQTPFFYQVSQPHMKNEDFLQEAVARYRGFLYLIKSNMDESVRRFCVPTYDIDLIWHTHQLHPLSYCNDMKILLGLVLEHDDMDSDRSVGKKLDVGFTGTTKQWDDTFGTKYWKIGAMYRGSAPRMQGVVKSGGCSAYVESRKMVKSDGCNTSAICGIEVKIGECSASTGCEKVAMGGMCGGCSANVEPENMAKSGGCGASLGYENVVKSGKCGAGCGSTINNGRCSSLIKNCGCIVGVRCGISIKSDGCTTGAGCGTLIKSDGCTIDTGCGAPIKNDGCTVGAGCKISIKSDRCTTGAGCGSPVKSDGCTIGTGCGASIKNDGFTVGAGCGISMKSNGCTTGAGCGISIKSDGCTIGAGCGISIKSDGCTIGAGCGITIKSDGCTIGAGCGISIKSDGCTTGVGCGSLIKCGRCTVGAGCGTPIKSDGYTVGVGCGAPVKNNGCTVGARYETLLKSDGCTVGAGCGAPLKNNGCIVGAGCGTSINSDGCIVCAGCGIMV